MLNDCKSAIFNLKPISVSRITSFGLIPIALCTETPTSNSDAIPETVDINNRNITRNFTFTLFFLGIRATVLVIFRKPANLKITTQLQGDLRTSINKVFH